ncbi:MAG TPA: hypothetical protein VFD92_25885 [Candidatus Binatia bacterium]|nr:hypothetical protein [Candidatus Binatia bacterium]
MHRAVVEIVNETEPQPGYFAALLRLLPGERLKVFTLNYDLCVERACELADAPCCHGI